MVHTSVLVLLPLLLVVVEGDYDEVTMHISGKIECPKNWFHYKMTVWEYDPADENDFVADFGWKDSFPEHTYKETAKISGWESGNCCWEVFLSIQHTCTSDGRYMTYQVVLADVDDDKEKVELKLDIKLFNQEATIESWPT
ncbi:unnamed protein product [Caenorhabditis brenneri]